MKTKTKKMSPAKGPSHSAATTASSVSASAVITEAPVPPATKPPKWETNEQVAARMEAEERYAYKCAHFIEPRDRRVMLRVNIRQMMFESQLIRRKENGYPRHHEQRAQLRTHRVNFLRPAQRNAQLALVFLRGKHAYSAVEANPRTKPDWREVQRLVTAFGAYQTDDLTKEQFTAAQAEQTNKLVEWSGGALKALS
jgi:hypothetical protein